MDKESVTLCSAILTALNYSCQRDYQSENNYHKVKKPNFAVH